VQFPHDELTRAKEVHQHRIVNWQSRRNVPEGTRHEKEKKMNKNDYCFCF